MIRRNVALVFVLLLSAACDKKSNSNSSGASPPSSASTIAAPPTPKVATATADASAAATPITAAGLSTTIDRSGERACVPKAATGDEPVSSWITAAAKDGVSFCLGRSRESDFGCFTLDVTSGVYTALPKTAFPARKAKVSTPGTHLLEGLEKEIKVCPTGAPPTDCTLIDVGKGYRQSENGPPPADISPDGKKLVVVRFLEGVTMNVDIYDLATKNRLSRTGVEGRGNLVGDVGWLGPRIFISSCVDAGPGCTPLLWDPETKKISSAAANVFGVDRPAHQVKDVTWGFIDSTGSSIALIDVETGFRKGEVKLPIASDVQNGVSVAPLGEGRVAIVAGAPQGGTIAVVDMNNAPKLVKRFSPVICAK